MNKGIIFIVNYGNADTTCHCIDALSAIENIADFEIAVIDNFSDENNVLKLKNFISTKNNIRLIESPENKGYFGAVNYAVTKLNIDLTDYNYSIVANNDIIIGDRDFIQKLYSINESADIIAPRVTTVTDSRDQNPHRKNPVSKRQKLMYSLLFTNYFVGLILFFFWKYYKSIFKKKHAKEQTPQYIFSLHGSIFIFKKNYFEKGGFIDDGYFLYGEEDSVAAICVRHKLKIYFDPSLEVLHDEHGATKAFGFPQKTYRLQKKAYKYIKKHYTGHY